MVWYGEVEKVGMMKRKDAQLIIAVASKTERRVKTKRREENGTDVNIALLCFWLSRQGCANAFDGGDGKVVTL